jgi:competence protein ComEC
MVIKGICFILSALVFIYTAIEYRQDSNLVDKISFLNIGQGDSSLIISKRGNTILIDCGPNSKVIDQVESKLGFWTKKIDLLIITHGDKDHYGGCRDVIQRFQVTKVMINGVFDSKNKSYTELLDFMKSQNIQILPAINNTYITLSDSIELQLLNPQTNLWGQDIRDDNPESIVIALKSANNSILLTGDADDTTESEILAKYPQLDIEVLKAGHHGSKTSTSDKFLDAITPKQVIISAGANNPYNHPNPDIINKLKQRNIEIQETKNYMTGIDILL